LDLRIHDGRKRLKDAGETEVWNETTGVSEARSKPGFALGLVNLRLLRLEGPPCSAKQVVVLISVVDRHKYGESAPYTGKPGPDALTSTKGFLETLRGQTFVTFNQVSLIHDSIFPVVQGSLWPFANGNQEFQIAPVKTVKADIVLRIVDAMTKKTHGKAVVRLAELLDQRLARKTLVVELPPESAVGVVAPTEKRELHLEIQFEFSKAKPIRDELRRLLEEKGDAERDFMALMLGRCCASEWAWGL
jgi:hypothetical protein